MKGKRFDMKKNITSKSVMLNWAISYLLMLIIPISVFFYGSMVTRGVIRDEVSSLNKLIMDSVKETLDSYLELMKSTYKFTFSNNTFKKMINAFNYDVEYRYNAYKLKQELSGYSVSNKNVGIMIYFKDKNYIVTNKTANLAGTLYYTQCMEGMDISFDEWIGLLSAKYNNEFFMASGLEIGSFTRCLAYCHSLCINGREMNIFVTIPDSIISSYNQAMDGRSIIIADSEGFVINSFGGNNAFQELDFTLEPEKSIIGNDGKSYVITYGASAQYDWYYTVATPELNYWFTLKRTTNFYILSIVISIFIGVVAAWLLLRRNYRPLFNITKTLRKYGTNKNEFELIAHSCNFLINENSNMQNILRAQTGQLQERYLLYTLKGRSLNYSEKDVKSYFKIDGLNENLCLVAFSIGKPSQKDVKYYCDELEYRNTVLFSLENVFRDLMKKYSYYKIEDGNTLLYLLHLNNKQLEYWDKEKISLMTFIYNFFNDRLSISVSCVISSIIQGIENIRYLYTDVMDAIDYKNITGEAGVMHTEEYKSHTELYKISVGEQWMQDLLSFVRNGDFEQCKHIINYVFQRYSQKTNMSLMVFRIAVNNCLYAILKSYCEIINNKDMQRVLVTKMIYLISLEKVKAMYESLISILDFACKTINNQNSSLKSILAQRVCFYIQENYSDINMNVNTIADVFKKNPNYLSQVFYQQTGESILDYIRNVRIQQAKDLMFNPGFTIEEISELVGFTNTKTFRRAFYRVIGVKPGKYREENLHLKDLLHPS